MATVLPVDAWRRPHRSPFEAVNRVRLCDGSGPCACDHQGAQSDCQIIIFHALCEPLNRSPLQVGAHYLGRRGEQPLLSVVSVR